MICEVTGVDILTDKPHSWYKPNKGNIERLLKLGKHAPPRPAPLGGSSSGGPSTYEPPSSSLGASASRGTVPLGKKKSIFNFLSQGLFACFNMGKHNAQEIRAHRQHVDEHLIKLESRRRPCSLNTTLSTLPSASLWTSLLHQPSTTHGRSMAARP
jgi:hypothetical protein